MNATAIWIIAYIPCTLFAGTAAYLVVEARYWPAFFMVLAAAVFQPGSTEKEQGTKP